LAASGTHTRNYRVLISSCKILYLYISAKLSTFCCDPTHTIIVSRNLEG